jgi:hypothetical protein
MLQLFGLAYSSDRRLRSTTPKSFGLMKVYITHIAVSIETYRWVSSDSHEFIDQK